MAEKCLTPNPELSEHVKVPRVQSTETQKKRHLWLRLHVPVMVCKWIQGSHNALVIDMHTLIQLSCNLL